MATVNVIDGLWLGHFSLKTLAAMVADLGESLTASRELAAGREGLEDFDDTLEQIVKAADTINDALGQIAVIVAYCEASYGTEATVEYLADMDADASVIMEARQWAGAVLAASA